LPCRIMVSMVSKVFCGPIGIAEFTCGLVPSTLRHRDDVLQRLAHEDRTVRCVPSSIVPSMNWPAAAPGKPKRKCPPHGGTCDGPEKSILMSSLGTHRKTANGRSRSYPIANLRNVAIALRPMQPLVENCLASRHRWGLTGCEEREASGGLYALRPMRSPPITEGLHMWKQLQISWAFEAVYFT
jgi:hypothetical protein